MLYRLCHVSNYPVPEKVSDIFDPNQWRTVQGFDFQDITYHRHVERDADGNWVRDLGTVRIAFDRPEVRNAFRPGTVDELYRAIDHARMTSDVGTVLLTGNGPSPKDGGHSFCSVVTNEFVAAMATGMPKVRPQSRSTQHAPDDSTSSKSSA